MNDRKHVWWVLLVTFALGANALAQAKVLYEKTSPYNTIVVTEDEHGLRTLQFEKNGARQSVVQVGEPDHLELPYVRASLLGLVLVEEPRRMLVVGVGGGTIPSFLHRHYPRATVDAVDIDPDVVAVARQFFGFQEDANLHAYVEDGRRFIEQHTNHYDLIVLDAYGSDSIPYHLATREFLQAVRRALTPRGLAVGNVWSRPSNRLYDSMVRTYQDVLDQLYILDAAATGNKIFFAIPRPERIRRNDLMRRASAVSQAKQFPLDLGALLRYGFRRVGKNNLRGHVLLDKPAEPKSE